jgi:glucose-6-phosphate 1-dehydrogenase
MRGDSVENSTQKHVFRSILTPQYPNAYEKLFFDAVVGDRTLFANSREVTEAWRITDQLRNEFQKTSLVHYAEGQKLSQMI